MIKTTHGNKIERIHALDSLRAIMMLLGLVIHSAITYGAKNYGAAWSIKDPEATSSFMDYIVFVIHNFRMPIFFVVAGFFGALLFFEKGPAMMIKNRITRIVYPLFAFIFILSPAIIFAFVYSKGVFAGNENPLDATLSIFSNPLIFIPVKTYHLWFLYYLLLISIVSFGLGILFEKTPGFTNWTTKIFNLVILNPWLKILVMTAFTITLLFIMNSAWVATSTSWIPDWKTFIFYFFFYIFGWILFKSKKHIDTFMKFDWLFTCLALVVITVEFLMSKTLGFEMKIILNSISVWLFIFGITGLFLRYGSRHSHLMRYNSDSSYWIYLIHLPIVALIPGLIGGWQLPALAKFLFVFFLTSAICVITYHYFVRSTFIGKFLNGRKYSRNIHARLETEMAVTDSAKD